MSVKVCLVNAPPYEIQEPEYDTPRFVRPALACLGATLRAAEISCKLIDAKFERLSNAQVLDRIRSLQPTVVGFTAFTNEIKPAAELARQVKQWNPDVVTVIGGVHFTALARQSMEEFPHFDIGCVGQGDLTIVEVWKSLASGGDLAEVKGIAYRTQNGDIQITPPSVPPSYDSLPEPAWDMLPQGHRYHVMTARGCPYKCSFCLNPNGRIVTQRTPEQVCHEITSILDHFAPTDSPNIWFDNEIFTIREPATLALCDALIEAGLHKRITWFAQTHVNVVNRDLFKKMKAAGCVAVGLGLESGDQSILKTMGKGSTVKRARAACAAAKSEGIRVEAFFIIGHPNETMASARETIELAVQVNPELPIIGIMVPYPGTKVAEKAQSGADGYRLMTTDWNQYNKQIGGALQLEHLTRFQLEWLQMTGYLKVFLVNRRYRDLANFVREYYKPGTKVVSKWIRGALASRGNATTSDADELRPIFAGNIHDTQVVLRVSDRPKD